MYIHLKINWYDIECLWDGLHIFQGDSIRDDALAVFRYYHMPYLTFN